MENNTRWIRCVSTQDLEEWAKHEPDRYYMPIVKRELARRAKLSK